MHILFLTDNFPPEVNAPASRTYEHCREWVRAGHRVTVVTCAPNFPQGKVYPGYRNRLFQKENLDGIEVLRVWTYITANEGFLRRTLDYLSFMLSASIAGCFVTKPDIVIGTSPQFFTTCAAWFLGKIRRSLFVFELRDLWPESIRAVGALKNERLLGFLEKVELFLYRQAALIIPVTQSFKTNLVERGIPAEKIEVFTNGVDLSRFQPRPKDSELVRKLGLEGCFVAGYIGTHGMAHGLETLLDAAGRLLSENDRKIMFLLLGDGARKAELVALARERQLTNVLFIDSVPKEEVARYWSLLDVCVTHLLRTELFETVIPSKIFESMAMGIPLVHGVAGESAEIVLRKQAGVVFEPQNAAALCDCLRQLRDAPERLAAMKGRAVAAAARYNRTAIAMDLLARLVRLQPVSQRSAPGNP